MCIILCDNNSTFMCVKPEKKKERTYVEEEKGKEKLFQKFIAKCGGGGLYIWEKYYLWTLNDDPIRFDFFGAKENFMLCVLYVKWRTKFYNKKIVRENNMFQYVFWH